MKSILRAVVKTDRLPFDWCRSDAFVLSKSNGKKCTDGSRLLHILGPVGKAWATAAARRSEPPKVAPYSVGFLRGRRKEAARLGQLTASWRCKQAGWQCVTIYHDMKNAFASTESK